jgi:DNA-binding NtrC family response regulator
VETILIVDDNEDLRFTLSDILKEEGYETIAVGDGTRAIKEVEKRSPNLVLLDVKLPGMDGVKILEEMKKIDKNLIVIMLTAYGDVKGAVRAIKLGAFDYITKPFDNEELTFIIEKSLKAQSLSREVENLRERLGEKTAMEEVMGESLQIKQVLNQVRIIAPTNMTVILQGESGTGKELIARMIHEKSRRKDKPFIAIDSGAIPETLVESELFGYEKGAFTGADDRKEGKFEQANGGTLFLDEITNLPDSVQMKLLRVFQERKIQHLGGKKDIRIDVRIIVATNINISDAGKRGKFREDLFHRLNEFNITLPSLHERKEDIPVLTKYFLEGANRDLNKKIKGISRGTMEVFLNYNWPGNVRELKNVIKRAVLLTEPLKEVSPLHLPAYMVNNIQAELTLPKNIDKDAMFGDAIRNFEIELIKKALARVNGNKIKAAKELNMNRKTLYRKMKSLGL